MKVLVLNYSFVASTRKITFTDYNPIIAERILLVTNTTDGLIIYNFADPSKGGTCATNVLTLAYNTTTMSNTDKLQIFYDDAATLQGISGTVTVANPTTNPETGLATSAKQLADGHHVAVNNFPAEYPLSTAQVSALTPPAAITGFATSAKQLPDGHSVALSATDNAVLDTIAAKDFATQTTLAALNTKLVTGTDIGDVTINNSTGAAAVNIQDGGNTITVDGTVVVTGVATETTLGTIHGHVDSIDTKTPALGQALAAASIPVVLTAAQLTTLTPATQGLTDAQLRATAVPISVASIPSHAVTNAGTFAVQIAANSSVNNAQINGVTPLMGNGVTGTGSQRVTIASDNTAFPIIASGNIAHHSADSGNPVKMGGRASATPVVAVDANDRVDAFFDVQGRQVVAQKALTGISTNIASSITNVTLLSANTARLGATIFNDSTSNLGLKLGATASATSFTVKMQPDSYFEVPFGYYGIIDGIWNSAVGSARITELT